MKLRSRLDSNILGEHDLARELANLRIEPPIPSKSQGGSEEGVGLSRG